MSLLQIIETIRDTKGIAAKKKLVEEYPEKGKLLAYFRNVLNPRVSVYQTGIEDIGPMQRIQAGTAFKKYLAEHPDMPPIEAALRYTMDAIKDGRTRGNAGKALLAAIYAEMGADDKRLYEMFIQRDVKCGLGVKSLNSIQEHLIPYSPYQRSEGAKPKYYEKLNWDKGVISQLKADGMFFNGDVELQMMGFLGDVQITSRDGNLLESASLANVKTELADLADEWSAHYDEEDSPIFHGELLVFDPEGNLLPREQGNGMLNRIIQTGEDLEEGYVVKAKIWDVIPRETFAMSKGKKEACGETYMTKYIRLTNIFEAVKPENIELIETKIVYSFEEASDHFQEMLDRGEEGTIIKDPDMLWYDGTSQQSLKLKMEMDVDLMIVALNEGNANGKHADTFGSIECESSCGQLTVGVHGLSDALRQEIFDNFESVWKGSILPVKSNGIIRNRDDESKWSLFLPRVGGERRLDKHEADSFERIKEIQEATIKNGGKTPANV